MHHPRLADYFEDFTRPYTSQTISSTSPHHYHHHGMTTGPNGLPTPANVNANLTYGSTGSNSSIPSFLPVEDIYVLPQFLPPNPEDEDDVVPDQHAAFGITRAMDRSRDAVWRDLGLEALVRGRSFGQTQPATQGQGPQSQRGQPVGRSEAGLRVKEAGRLMGGRRTVCLR